MPEGVASLAGRAAPWLLTYLLHSTTLIAAVWLLDRGGLVRRQRTLDLLWKAALLAGFVTSTVVVARATRGVRATITNVEAVVRRDAGDAPGGALVWGVPGASRRFRAHVVEPSTACRRLIDGGPPAGEAWLGAVQAACGSRAPDWRALLVAAWVVGAGGLVLLAALERRRLAEVLAECAPAGGRIAEAGAAALGRMARVRWRVVVSGSVSAPCAVGGRVVLPARCEEEMDDGELAAVLAHELAHLERRDPLWLAVADLACRIAWVQPLNRLAARGVRDSAELMSDQRTLRFARPLDLARSIHRVSHWALPGAHPARAAGLARTRDGSLTRRVRRILTPGGEGSTGPAWPGAVLALALTVGALLLPPVLPAREVRAIFVERVEGAPAQDDVARDDDARSLGTPAVGTPATTRVVIRVLRGDTAEAPGH